jgi:hypothetical protein
VGIEPEGGGGVTMSRTWREMSEDEREARRRSMREVAENAAKIKPSLGPVNRAFCDMLVRLAREERYELMHLLDLVTSLEVWGLADEAEAALEPIRAKHQAAHAAKRDARARRN